MTSRRGILSGTQDGGTPMLVKYDQTGSVVDETDGEYTVLRCNANGGLNTFIQPDSFMLGAFGEQITANKNPEIQHTFSIHLDPAEFNVNPNSTNGTYSVSNDVATFSTSTDTDGEIVVTSRKYAHYHAGQGILIQFSMITPTITSGHTFAVGLGNANDGVFFGGNGSDFGVIIRKDGSDTFIARSAWDDPLDGTGRTGGSFTTTNGNVYFIQVMWHGMGNIYFYVFDKNKRVPTLVHTYKFADLDASGTSFGNPGMPFRVECIKTSGATNLALRLASFSVFSEGSQMVSVRTRSTDRANLSLSSGTTHVLTVRNRTTVLGVTNPGEMVITHVSVSNVGGKPHGYRIYKNANLSSASYSNVDEVSSIAEKTTAGTLDAVESNTAQAVSATTITLASGANASDDYYNGRSIVITSATLGTNQTRTILDYNGTTKVATVTQWTTTPTGTVEYTITNGYQVGAITTAGDDAFMGQYGDDGGIHLSPGESCTITVTTTNSSETTTSLTWRENV